MYGEISQYEQIIYNLACVGYANVVGYLAEGLDVCEVWEYKQGHVPGATLIPLGQLASRLSELNPEMPVAVICASGSRSQSAAALLGQKGFKTVYNVVGGTGAWMYSGLELEKN